MVFRNRFDIKTALNNPLFRPALISQANFIKFSLHLFITFAFLPSGVCSAIYILWILIDRLTFTQALPEVYELKKKNHINRFKRNTVCRLLVFQFFCQVKSSRHTNIDFLLSCKYAHIHMMHIK